MAKFCVVCGKEFFSSSKERKKVCSPVCKTKWKYVIYGRPENNNLSSSTTGAIAELNVCSYLMSKGYAVFRSLSPACFCDAVIIKNNKKIMLEIKTGYKSLSTNKIIYPKKCPNTFDVLAVYIRNENKTYFTIKKINK